MEGVGFVPFKIKVFDTVQHCNKALSALLKLLSNVIKKLLSSNVNFLFCELCFREIFEHHR